MNRIFESQLLDFCAEQQASFAADRWVASDETQRLTLAAVAFLLASHRWYGHRAELLKVAGTLHNRLLSDFPELVRKLDLDCARFVQMLRQRLSYDRTVV